jgi:hypothetical protein
MQGLQDLPREKLFSLVILMGQIPISMARLRIQSMHQNTRWCLSFDSLCECYYTAGNITNDIRSYIASGSASLQVAGPHTALQTSIRTGSTCKINNHFWRRQIKFKFIEICRKITSQKKILQFLNTIWHAEKSQKFGRRLQ